MNKRRPLAPPPLGKTMGHGLLTGSLTNSNPYKSMNLTSSKNNTKLGS